MKKKRGANTKEHLEKFGIVQAFWTDFLRPAIFEIKGKQCELCGSTKRLCIHHLDYEKQTIDSFQVVCFSCHSKGHRNANKEEK